MTMSIIFYISRDFSACMSCPRLYKTIVTKDILNGFITLKNKIMKHVLGNVINPASCELYIYF